MNVRVLLVGALLTVPLLAFLAISFRFDPRTIDSPLIGQPAPEFVLADLNGNVVRSADLAGRPAVVNFWATWCRPCLVEHPVFVEAARRYEGRVRFLGVVYQDEPELIRQFVSQRGAWGPALIDPGTKVAIAFGVYGVPETFFIDAEGTVVKKLAQAIDRRALDQILEPLL